MLKKTICGACGRVHRGWYDRRVRRVRDLSCGDVRIDLEVEVRRVKCRSCASVKGASRGVVYEAGRGGVACREPVGRPECNAAADNLI